MKRPLKTVLFALSSFLGGTLACANAHAWADSKITFDDHIKPIFREHCVSCHNQSEKKADLALDTFGATMTGGSSGEVLVAGELDSSRLWELVAHLSEPRMPPKQDKLVDAKLLLIKQWIEQGMPENSGSVVKKKSNVAAAMLTSASTGKPEGPPAMPLSMLKQPTVFTSRPAAIAALAASPWAPLVAVGGQKQVAFYSTESGQLLGIVPFPEGEPQSLNFTRDGKQLLIGGGSHSVNGCAVLVDVASGERLAKVGDELDIVLASDISPDKRRIALGGPQKLIRIYDTATGELIKEIKKHTDWIYALRFSPDGVLLASSDRSNGLAVWEADEGRLYADLVGHKGEIRSLDFRGDSNVLASGSLDGTIKLWDMAESRLQKSIDAHGGGVTSVAYTHEGSMASCGRDGKVKLWAPDGSLKGEYAGLTEAALEVAIPGSGAQLISGDWNGRVQLWQVADAKKTIPLAANPPTLTQMIEQAKAAVANSQALADQSAKAAAESSAKAAEALGQLTASENAVKAAADQLTAAQQTHQRLSADMKNRATIIAELEMKLAEAKSARDKTGAQLSAANETLNSSAKAAEAAKIAQAAAKVRHDELAAANQIAIANQNSMAAQTKAAVEALARAEADLVAFEKMSVELKKQSDAIAAQSAEVQKQLAEASLAEKTKQDSVQKRQEEMQQLQKEMATLQVKIAAVTKDLSTAQSDLNATQSKAAQLKAALEKAQQEAAAASEKMKLFMESYKTD